jgi:ABC-type phosphate transport system ATPase subunit
VVIHNMQQPSRGLVEFGQTRSLFTNPCSERTEDDVTGRVG